MKRRSTDEALDAAGCLAASAVSSSSGRQATAGTLVSQSEPAGWRATMLAAVLLAVAAIAAYRNSFSGTFVYDDIDAILENQSIRQLWPLWQTLSPPANGETVSGRPLVNLSLAINYALGGLDIWGYHAVNLAIHIAAALTLWGILRRTLQLPALRERFGRVATPLALSSALLWTVHPLETESVTYIVQRAESLAGLFYLLTLYCVIRGAARILPSPASGTDELSGPPSRDLARPARLWYAAAVTACLLGMASKEIVVTAPLAVLLYDRTFLAGSFAAAWRQRWRLYLGLAATWGLLAYLVLSAGLVFRQPEMGAPDALSYARTQPGVILHYLRLSVWPSSLCLGYEWPVANRLSEILPGTIAVALLLAAAAWGLLRRSTWGFLAVWFVVILLPTSSVFPLGEMAFEHRMYLSLAAVVVLGVVGGYRLWDRLISSLQRGHRALWDRRHRARIMQTSVPRGAVPFFADKAAGRDATEAGEKGDGRHRSLSAGRLRSEVIRWAVPVLAVTTAAISLGRTTFLRNHDYRSALAFWQDTLEKCPNGFFAHYYYANVLAGLGRTEEAIAHFHEALRRNPRYSRAHYNLANALAAAGKTSEAIEYYRQCLRLNPDNAEAHNNLANCLTALGQPDAAIEHYRAALRLAPDYAPTYNNLGAALAAAGSNSEAAEQYRQALRLNPDYAEAHSNLGGALIGLGKTDEAIEQYREALRLNPKDAAAHNNLGLALAAVGKTLEAIEHYRRALETNPKDAAAHYNLGNVLAGMGRTAEAIEHLDQALLLKPDNAEAQNNFATLLVALGDTDKAIERFAEACRLKPDFAAAHYNLAQVLAAQSRTAEAIASYDRFLRLVPESAGALNNLAWLLASRKAAQAADSQRAILLAQRAIELAGRENAPCLDTLAAAYAASGRFAEAVTTAERAVALAESAGQAALATKIRSRLELYCAGRPYQQ